MDTIIHHFYESVFNKPGWKIKIFGERWYYWWRETYTNRFVSHNPSKGRVKMSLLGIKFNKPIQLCDGWHFFKMIMILMIMMSLLFNGLFFISAQYESWYIWAYFIFTGFLWNIVFNIFYDHILLK